MNSKTAPRDGLPERPKELRHSIDDHMFGDFYPHDHDDDADHDHDDINPGPLEDNPIWQRDNVMLTSVGIDIGSAGTQVIFSRVHLQRVGTSLASKYVIIDRATAFESEIAFTPFADATTIDGPELGAIIDKAYRDAKVHPADIDAGVVILTGEALRRQNAEAVAGIVSEMGGDFVTATAGNHMEAMLAAYGSGAAKTSYDSGQRILNVDIGGGTTKLALCEAGKVVWTGALHIGGRLLATEDGRVVRIDPAGAHHARAAGLDLKPGDPLTQESMARVAEGMAGELTRILTSPTLPAETARLFLTDLPENLQPIDGLMFSGGVGEYVYERETRSFGDLGIHLGRAIRARAQAGLFNAPVLPSAACIRATALGASEYSVQLSGQTSTITSPARVLPRRNMPVLKPYLDMGAHPGPDDVANAILRHFEAFDMAVEAQDVALVFDYRIPPDYQPIRSLAEGIAGAMAPRLDKGHPLYVIIDGDIAQTLGGILRDEIGLSNDLLVLDGLSLRDFDYIDLGKIRLPSFTVPVTVKSLLFAEDPRGPRGGERIHFRAGDQSHGHHHHHDKDQGHSHDHGHHHHRHHTHSGTASDS